MSTVWVVVRKIEYGQWETWIDCQAVRVCKTEAAADAYADELYKKPHTGHGRVTYDSVEVEMED